MAAYEVLLLNTAVPQIQAAQSGDTYVVPRDIAFSAALTLSAGTANGVPYLNGSKVLTTGSALTFDGTTFTNAGGAITVNKTSGFGNVSLNLAYGGTTNAVFNWDAGNGYAYLGTTVSAGLGFNINASEQMRLTSTGLGIGTSSPASTLDVRTSTGATIIVGRTSNVGATSQPGALNFTAPNASGTTRTWAGVRAVVGTATTGSESASIIFSNQVAGAYTDTLNLDSAGNLGLGVTPSAWNSATKAMQISTAATFWGLNNNQAYVGSNSFYDSLGNFKYIVTDNATQYRQWQGAHAWFTAPSGTAGNAITFTQAMTLDASGNLGIGTSSPDSGFQLTAYADVAGAIRVRGGGAGSNTGRTASLSLLSSGNEEWIVRGANDSLRFLQSSTERARIDSSGRLIVGSTSSNGDGSVEGVARSNSTPGVVAGSRTSGDVGSAALLVTKFDNDSTTSQVFQRFSMNNNGTASGQINANGANAVAFGSWSDARLKKNITDLPQQLANVMALRPVEFDYIESEGGGHQTGFIAQEMQAVYPDAVGERQDGMLTVTGWSKTEARLVKAIQELKAEFDAYKATHP